MLIIWTQTSVAARSPPADKRPSSSQLALVHNGKVPPVEENQFGETKPGHAGEAPGHASSCRITRPQPLSEGEILTLWCDGCSTWTPSCGYKSFKQWAHQQLAGWTRSFVCPCEGKLVFNDRFPDKGVDEGVGDFPGNNGGLPGGGGILSLHLSPTLLASPLCLLTFRLSREALCNFPKWLIYL